MARNRKLGSSLLLFPAIFALATLGGCNTGAAASGNFDRSFNVTGPIRLELSNASGDVNITGSSDGKVHVHGEVRASGFGFDNPQKRLDDTIANPPVEQRGDTIRIGADFSHLRNVSIAYNIQVPHDTEVDANVASGAQNIRDPRGPVKVHAASGRVYVEGNPGGQGYWNLKTASGAVQISVPASANFHLSAEAVSGEIRTDIPIVVEEQGKHSLRARVGNGGGRIEVRTASGEIRVTGSK